MKRSALLSCSTLSWPILACPILLALLLHTLPSWAGDDVEAQLKADYLGKVLTLHHFYEGNRLVFRSDGSLAGSAPVGPWTVDGQLLIQRIELHGHTLRIRGRRVCVVFDSKTKSFHDVLDWLGESASQDRNKQEKAFLEKTVDIRFELTSRNPDATQVSSAMKTVFLAPGESVREFVPDFWRDYFDQVAGQPKSAPHSTGVVYHPKKGEVSGPRRTSGREPEFSDEARIAKYQGTMLLSLVVDPSGTPRDVAIVRPLGLGLDEHAVEQVSEWKFEPGMKDGTPVPVEVMVEVSFHLY